jgi:hypothetical protein
VSAAQGKDTYGFLPLHPFLPLPQQHSVRSPRNIILARAFSGSLSRHRPRLRAWDGE